MTGGHRHPSRYPDLPMSGAHRQPRRAREAAATARARRGDQLITGVITGAITGAFTGAIVLLAHLTLFALLVFPFLGLPGVHGSESVGFCVDYRRNCKKGYSFLQSVCTVPSVGENCLVWVPVR